MEKQKLNVCSVCGRELNPIEYMKSIGSGNKPICQSCVRKKHKEATK